MSRSVLFLPGAGADAQFWQPVGDLLPQAWHKVYLGWPGIGHNPPSPDVNSFEDLVKLAETHLPETEVDLVAQSMGGAIALALALKHPTRVRRLVLTTTAGGIDVAALGGHDWRPDYRAEYPSAAEWLYSARPNFDAQLSTIVQPTLLIFGDSDPISPLSVGEYLKQKLPFATLHVVAGGTHALALEQPTHVAALLFNHLSEA